MDTGIAAVIAASVAVAFLCSTCCFCWRAWRRRRSSSRAPSALWSLDPDERRFKRRLERQMQEIDDIFADEDGGGEEEAGGGVGGVVGGRRRGPGGASAETELR